MAFLDRLLAVKVERYLLEGGQVDGHRLPGLLSILSSFTPDGLGAFIAADQSLTALYEATLPKAAFSQGRQALRRHREAIETGVAGMDPERVLAKISRALPGQGQVLTGHRTWYYREAELLADWLKGVLDAQS